MKYQVVTANNSLMPAYFQGRWAEKIVAGQPVMYSTNLGAEFDFRVNAASWVRLKFLPRAVEMPSWVAIQIDGLPFQRQAVTADAIQLTMDQRPHVIRVVMSGNTDEDQVWTGDGGFAVQSLTSDGQLQPVQLGHRSITFIGDSITAGCWVAGQKPAEDYRGEANYAAIASDRLGARNVRIAYSAAGLSKPGTGGVPPLVDVLTQLDATTPWTPIATDLVVINVGTNDGRESAEAYLALFSRFLKRVQTLYPDSQIVVMIPFSQRFDRIIRKAVAQFSTVDLIETAEWQPGLTDHVHLNLAGSQVAGQALAQVLQQRYPQLFLEG